MGFKDVFREIPVVGGLFGRTEDALENEIFRQTEIDDQMARQEPLLRLNQEILQENMSYQNDLAKEMFDYEADYNKPINQRLRNAQAGLNENWVDNSGVIQGGLGATPTMPSVSGASAESKLNRKLEREQLSNHRRQTDLNFDMQQKQKELIEEQKRTEKSKQNLNDKQADWYDTDAAGKEIDNIYRSGKHQADISETNANAEKLRNDVKWQDALGDQQIKESNERIDEMIARQDNLNATTKQINELLPKLKEKTDAETAELYARAKAEEMNAQAAVYNAETNRLQVGVNAEMVQEIKRHNVQAEKLQKYMNESQSHLNKRLAKVYEEQAGLIHVNELMSELQNELMHYAKANGIPQQLMLLQVEYAREKLYHEQDKRTLTKEQADNIATQTILAPITSVFGITTDIWSNINASGNVAVNAGRLSFDIEKFNHDKDGWNSVTNTYNSKGEMTGTSVTDHRPN